MRLGPVAIPSVSQVQEWKESVVAFHLSRRKPLLSESALHPGGHVPPVLFPHPLITLPSAVHGRGVDRHRQEQDGGKVACPVGAASVSGSAGQGRDGG